MNNEQTPEMLKIMNDSDALLEAELAALERGEDPYANTNWDAPEAVMRTEPQQPCEMHREPEIDSSSLETDSTPTPLTLREQWDAHMTEERSTAQQEEMLTELSNTLPLLFKECGGRLAVRGKSLLGYDILNGVYDIDHIQELAAALIGKSLSHAYIWWATLNPFDDTVEITNTLRWGFGIPKKHITRACWLVIDFDPTRTEPEANTDEREASQCLMEGVKDFLLTRGLSHPWVVMSGNGYQLRYRVDLPADRISELLLKSVMLVLDKLYTNDAVKVDTSLWDLPRVCKIPGTFSRKGMPKDDRPNMLAKTISCPESFEVIDAETLQQFVSAYSDLLEVEAAAEAKRQEREYAVEKMRARTGKGYLTVEEAHARVQEFCHIHGIGWTTDVSGDVMYYRLDRCFYLEACDADYTTHREDNKTATHIDVWITGRQAGKIGAGCHVDCCKELCGQVPFPKWELMKRLADPEYAARAEEWDKKTEGWKRDDDLKAKFETLGAEAMNSAGIKDAGHIIFDLENLPKGVSLSEPTTPLSYETEETWNDTGNGQRFVSMWGEDVRNVSPKGFGWYTWNGSFWERDEDNKQVLVYAKDTASRIKDVIKNIPMPDPIPDNATKEQQEQYKADMKDYKDLTDPIKDWARQSGNQARLNAMLAMAACERKVSVMFEQLNKHSYLLPVQNGVVDLRTGELQEAKREYLLTNQCPYPYFENAECPNWMKWIETIFCGDESLIRYAQYASGSLLIGDNADQSMYFLYGSGKNGKSTMAETISKVLGDGLAMLLDFRIMKQSESDNSRRDLAEMLGKRAVVVSESERNDTLAEGFIKRATGETHIVGERKYGNPFKVPVTFTMWVMTQHLPRIVGQDTGIWRRLRILPFLFTIPEEDRDKHFIENNFSREFPGILRWLVEGALLHQDTNEDEIMPQICRDLLQSYREANDLFSEFVEKCLIISPKEFVSNEDLKLAARQWGERNNALALTNAGVQSFINMFQNCPLTSKVKQGRHRVKDTQVRGFLGVGLSAEGMRGLIGKGRDDQSTMSGGRA